MEEALVKQYKPTQYELTAVAAAALAANGVNPVDAWDSSARSLCGSPSTAAKPCPRSTFLGLASAGVISGVLPGEYGAPGKNAKYALDALELLRADHSLAARPTELWRLVMKGDDKKYNQQMHVVVALWREKKLAGQTKT
jgi:hypothetical protein